ncbi:hypothetical protein CEXT_245001 [Caerostris extrusa]|uniref:Uncharacterized protein n=1 Tax=Caerostris extrusa TaxID=172846 RepID=A0AAV4V3B0_CAEEX|nr:hypothetical protein CEXT_245001 [Caerostris extrusa]
MGSTRGGWRVDSTATMTAVKVVTWVLRGRCGSVIDGMAQERLSADNAPEKESKWEKKYVFFVKNRLLLDKQVG